MKKRTSPRPRIKTRSVIASSVLAHIGCRKEATKPTRANFLNVYQEDVALNVGKFSEQ